MKPVRGRSYWFPFPQDGAATAHMMTDEEEQSTGFRLVHDSAGRVLRGGGWDFSAQFAREAIRLSFFPGDRDGSLGFRLVFDREAQ